MSAPPPPAVSLIVATRGRGAPLLRLFESLARQTRRDFEVIVVDQNPEPTVLDAVFSRDWPFQPRRLRRPAERGASRGRNTGLAEARAPIVLFPDDDCWYPNDFLAAALEPFQDPAIGFLCGRPADAAGRTINGRFLSLPCAVTRRNVWETSIEWLIVVRAEAVRGAGGFDPRLGVGAETPWQAAEGPDLLLRLMRAGVRGVYDPGFVGHHEEIAVETADARLRAKLRGYARGKGRALRRNGYGLRGIGYWAARSAAGALVALARGRAGLARVHAGALVGRVEGFLGLAPGRR